MEAIEITTAMPEDAEGMQEVFYRSWLATYPNEEHGITAEDIEDHYKDRLSPERLAHRRAQILAQSDANRFIVARDRGTVIGVLRAVRKADVNHLQTIYLLPEYRRRGIGTRLWEEARKTLDPAHDDVVEVVSYNAPAIAFYEKLGFRDTGERFTDERFRMKSGSVLPEMRMRRKAGR